jgi:hypothetical protein
MNKSETKTKGMYQNIFVSYSRKDKDIVEISNCWQEAIGNCVFIDKKSIRSGDFWGEKIFNAIDKSDIFQLFWSENSKKSKNVREEWEYALKCKCQNNKGEGFIRPVHWKEPYPKLPKELKDLNCKLIEINKGNADNFMKLLCTKTEIKKMVNKEIDKMEIICNNDEYYSLKAKGLNKYYNALLKEGFDKNQAIKLMYSFDH